MLARKDDGNSETVTSSPGEPLDELRAELRARAASEALLRGQLADARAQLDARASGETRWQSTLAELRDELDKLARENEELRAASDRLRGRLTVSEVSREGLAAEAAGLRSEIDRLGAELTAARRTATAAADDDELGQAEALLAEARALRVRVTSREDSG